MPVKIITDSTADLPAQWAKDNDVRVVPLSVHFGSETYIDGVTISNDEFYSKMKASRELPKTSQLTPEELYNIFKEYSSQGFDVVGIFISSELSGTYQSAHFARNMLDNGKVFIIDSRNVTFGLALLVEQAVRLRNEGMRGERIALELEKLKSRVCVVAVLQTLENLHRGGRLSATSAVVGSLLNIKPLIVIKDGKVEFYKKCRGLGKAIEEMGEFIRDRGMHPEVRNVAFGHSQSADTVTEIREKLSVALPEYAKEFEAASFIAEVGSVVGTHAGVGCAGIAWFTK